MESLEKSGRARVLIGGCSECKKLEMVGCSSGIPTSETRATGGVRSSSGYSSMLLYADLLLARPKLINLVSVFRGWYAVEAGFGMWEILVVGWYDLQSFELDFWDLTEHGSADKFDITLSSINTSMDTQFASLQYLVRGCEIQ